MICSDRRNTKQVLLFFPLISAQTYKGGVLTILERYVQNAEEFCKYNYCISYNSYASTGRSQKSRGVLRRIKVHLDYIFRYSKLLVAQARDYDLIHIHTSRNFRLIDDLFVMLLARRKTKRPFVVSLHRADLEKTITRNRILQKIYITLLKHAEMIIFLSSKTREEFVERGVLRDKTAILSTFHVYSPNTLRTVSLNESRKQFRLLFMGFLSREKGILEILEAMKCLPNHIVLDICGGIKDENLPEFDQLCKELGARVEFHGYLSGEAKEKIFENANVFVLPSYGEGMPLAILEALHHGLPIITTEVGAVPEILESNVNAVFVKPKSIESLSQAIISLSENKELRTRMQKANRELSTKFGVNENIKQLCEIYESVLKQWSIKVKTRGRNYQDD